jgi:hypothetical protein
MLTFLFWNLNRKRLETSVARLAQRHQVDAVILAEVPEIAVDEMLFTLNSEKDSRYHYVPVPECFRIRLFLSAPLHRSKNLLSDNHFVIQEFVSNHGGIIVVAVHMPSQLRYQPATLNSRLRRLARQIRSLEQGEGHRRTIVFGDFNLNPFDSALVEADGLHGVMTKQIARQRERKVGGVNQPFFYNPMWRFLGDSTPGPPGSFFYRDNEDICFFWNILDQVLIRPDLLDTWCDDDLQLLTGDGVVDFWTEEGGMATGAGVSDHLPLLFRFDLTMRGDDE